MNWSKKPAIQIPQNEPEGMMRCCDDFLGFFAVSAPYLDQTGVVCQRAKLRAPMHLRLL